MMRKLNYLLVFVMFAFAACTNNNEPKNAEIRINQVGYYPGGVKKAVVANSKADKFELKSADGKTVFTGKLSKEKFWDKSGENLKIADFSSYTKQGEYYLTVKDAPKSCVFSIKDHLYKDAFRAALKSYYLIRASMPIEEKYAGKFARNEGHPDTLCYFHPSAGRGEGHAPSPKGWYDAGDYNKYVVNGGVTVGTLLALEDMYPDFTGDATNIPESGNGISDLLDETKYELDWVLTMQTSDGASNMKLTSKGFTGFILPEKDKTKRFFVGKATAPTLNFAAMMAMAARLYRDIDPEFSGKCLAAAEKAWNWAEKNPDVVYKNPPDVKTGEYSDTDFTEEFWWAASELYLATDGKKYEDYLLNNKPYMTFEVGESWRVFLGNLGSFSLVLSNKELPGKLKEKIDSHLLRTANQLLENIKTIPYLIPVDEFVWGSNSDFQNAAMVMAYAYKITGDKKYLNGVIETMDYVFGKNATGYSFVTGFGCKTPVHPHNRICGGDTVAEPIPGLVVGGPNNNREDVGAGVVYPDTLPAKSYVDDQPSFASNETAINWNAPAVFVLGFLEANDKNLK